MAAQALVVGSPMLDVTALGADRFPRPGRTEVIAGSRLGLGGCALNTAVVLARLGLRTAMVGKVGDDPAGRFLRELLGAEPLDASRIVTVPGGATTVCFVFVTARGERQFLIALAAGETVAIDDVGDLGGVSAVHVGAALQLERLDVAELFRRARAAGAMTTLDVENGPGLDRPERLHRLLPFADWFMPSEEEARRATGCGTPAAAAERLRALGARGVVVKRAEEPCLVSWDGGTMTVAPPRVAAVDATGAGDCFAAGFIAALLWGFAVPDAVAFACACGARAVTAVGATAGIARRDDVLGLVAPALRARLAEKWRGDVEGH